MLILPLDLLSKSTCFFPLPWRVPCIKNNSKYLFSSSSTIYPCLDEPKDRICTVLLDMCVYIETFSRANYNPSACCLSSCLTTAYSFFQKSSSSRIHLKMPIKRVNKVSWGIYTSQSHGFAFKIHGSFEIICAWKSNSWVVLLFQKGGLLQLI